MNKIPEIELDDETYNYFKIACKQESMSFSALAERLIRRYVQSTYIHGKEGRLVPKRTEEHKLSRWQLKALDVSNVLDSPSILGASHFNKKIRDIYRGYVDFIRDMSRLKNPLEKNFGGIGQVPIELEFIISEKISEYQEIRKSFMNDLAPEADELEDEEARPSMVLVLDWIIENLMNILDDLKHPVGLPCLKCGSIDTHLNGTDILCNSCGHRSRKSAYWKKLVDPGEVDPEFLRWLGGSGLVAVARYLNPLPHEPGSPDFTPLF